MAEKKSLDDVELDEFFAAARNTTPVVSEDFMARILSDAMAQMPMVPDVGSAAAGAVSKGWLQRLFGPIGGWPAAAGLATATVAGLMIGMATPDTLDQWTGGYLGASIGYQVEDFLPSFGDILGEG